MKHLELRISKQDKGNRDFVSEIEGINSIGKSVSVSFHVRVVRASGRARRSGVGAYGSSASNAGGPVANICAGPVWLAGRLLCRRKGFKLFWSKVYYMQGFSAVGLSWLRRCKGFKGMQLRNLEHIIRRKGFKAF